jgi:hypothetical protein
MVLGLVVIGRKVLSGSAFDNKTSEIANENSLVWSASESERVRYTGVEWISKLGIVYD